MFGNGYEYAEYMMEIGRRVPRNLLFSICGVDGNGKMLVGLSSGMNLVI